MSHTKEPWRIEDNEIYAPEDCYFHPVATTLHGSSCRSVEEATGNARRIVACVNACAGIGTDTLEAEGSAVMGWNRTARKLIDVAKQRDELMAALVKARMHVAWAAVYVATGLEPTKKQCERVIEVSKPDSDIGEISAVIATIKAATS